MILGRENPKFPGCHKFDTPFEFEIGKGSVDRFHGQSKRSYQTNSAWELFPVDRHSHTGEAIAFFIYDVPKVLLLRMGIGFVSAGIPLGVTFSFLIAGPVGPGLLYGLVGWKIATIYFVFGFTIATVAGVVLGQMGLARYLQDWVRELNAGAVGDLSSPATATQRHWNRRARILTTTS
jgi:hypothetical protein